MTKEEKENAIRCLKIWIEREPYLQTYRTCLEALEKELCDDCISRLDTLMTMKIMMDDATIGDGDNDYATLDDFKQQYIEIVKGMAPVTSQPKIEQEPCDDTISRADVIEGIRSYFHDEYYQRTSIQDCRDCFIEDVLTKMPPVTPQQKIGQWLRMSDLSEQEDDRYQCSRCRNVVHYKNKMNLYTFNSWCGRCGSNNGRK